VFGCKKEQEQICHDNNKKKLKVVFSCCVPEGAEKCVENLDEKSEGGKRT
jgi:hypothetical protein